MPEAPWPNFTDNNSCRQLYNTIANAFETNTRIEEKKLSLQFHFKTFAMEVPARYFS